MTTRNRREAIPEIEVAAPLVTWLGTQGWEVFQEVSLGYSQATIDLVARKDGVLWAIECKGLLSLALLEQATRHLGIANGVSIAAPILPGEEDRRLFVTKALTALGMGRIGLKQRRSFDPDATDDPEPRWVPHELIVPVWKPTDDYLAKKLHDGQRTFAASGNAEGKRWSPFQQTCMDIAAYVQTHSGCSIKECVANVKHHYGKDSTARTSMSHWIEEGKVPGVVLRKTGCISQLFPLKEASDD